MYLPMICFEKKSCDFILFRVKGLHMIYHHMLNPRGVANDHVNTCGNMCRGLKQFV